LLVFERTPVYKFPVAPLLKSCIRISAVLIAIYLGLVGVLYLAQGRLIYLASRAPEETMLKQAAGLALEPWRDPSGAVIGWRRPNPKASNRIVVFHGNAGWALLRDHFVEALQAVAGGRSWEVLLFEYPGYGARPGAPSETTIVTAAANAIDHLLASDSRPLFIMGESLGSGPASTMAGRYQDRIRGLALLVPYQSLADAAEHHYPFVPVSLIMKDRFDNGESLKKYRGPVAFALAEQDEVVTFAGGRKLHDAYDGPKKLIVFPGLRHNDLDYTPQATWWSEISTFLLAARQP
jgi:pimeloyl-ACP methyl ester carboxylesterase